MHHEAAMYIPFSSSTVGASPLITTLRQMRPDDVETTIEALPPPTSTVPALRPRAHRGGKSILLKDAFPSGFQISRNNPQEEHQLHVHISRPRETNDNIFAGRPVFPLAGSNEGCMMRGKKASGMTPWGSPGGKRLLTVTQVAIGSRVVPDAIGSELVQFGPGIPCGPPEQPSPRRLDGGIRMIESDTNLSCINLDGSALLEKEKIHVATSAGAEILQKSDNRIRSITHEPTSWRLWTDFAAMVNIPGPASQVLAQRASSGSNGCFFGAPCTKEMCLVSPSTERPTAEARVGTAKRSFQGYNKKKGGGGCGEGQDQASAYEGCDNKGPRQQPEDSCPEIGVKILRRRSASRYFQKKNLTDLPAAGLAGISQDKESGRTGGTATTVKRNRDNSDRESFAVLQGESDFSLESVTPPEAPTIVSSVSLSSLDTERYYGGNISADATEILRSYIESRNISLEGVNANFPGNPDFPRTDSEEASKPRTMSLYIPSRPFLKEFDSLLGHLPAPRATKTLFNARPLENLSRCYMSTQEDVILAVVRKEDLLGCENDLEIRRLKDAAYPMRITANMNLKEGIRAIVSSGVLSAEGVGGEEQAVVSATRSGSVRWDNSRTWVLEYFDWRTGTWNAVCNENDWYVRQSRNVLLATPSGPAGRREGARNGAMFSFRSFGHKLHRADFLVTVTSAPLASRSPHIQRRKMRELAWFSPCSAETFEVTRANAGAGNDRSCWPRASPVTTGILASQQVRSRKLGEMRDPPCSPSPTNANVLPAGVPGVISLEEKNTVGTDSRLAGPTGVRTRRGPGPGGALWTSATSYSDSNGTDFYPKKAKVRRLVKRLEARLRLKSKPGAGCVPAATAQKTGIETPYTRELAKWGYDKILGSSQAVVNSSPIC